MKITTNIQQTLSHPGIERMSLLRGILMVFGVLVGSTAVILIKASTEHPLLVASYRLLIAAFILAPFFVRELKQSGESYTWQHFRWSAAPAVILALHFVSWVIAARIAPVANASLLVNLTPIALPFFLWIFYREVITRVEVIGSLIALSGVVLLTGANFSADPSTIWGNLVTIASMLAFACYLALGRANGTRIRFWVYLVPLYTIAGIICLVTALFFINPIKTYSPINIFLIIALGLFPTVLAHSILNYSLKYFRGQVVGVTNLFQPVASTCLGFFIFGEIPEKIFYLSAALVIGGILVVILLSSSQRSTQKTSPE